MKLHLRLSIGYEIREEIIDPSEDWGVDWDKLDPEEKQQLVDDWATNYIDYGYEVISDD